MVQPPSAIINQAAATFGIAPSSVQFLRDASNVIYDCQHASGPAILRLTPDTARSPEMIRGEMDFMAYLAQNAGRVPRVMRSRHDQLVAQVPGYYVTVLEKVPGVHPEGAALTSDMIGRLGQTLGRMHRLARGYTPGDPALRRPHWHALELFDFEKTIPESQPDVRAQCQQVLAEVRALPVDETSYGLIHADPEPWNFLVHDGQVAVIDFDDCCYHWFAFDVAVALLYITWAADRHDDPTFPQRAWEALWAGYQTEYTLNDFWRGQMPLLLRLRIMEDYAFHSRLQAEGNTEEWLPGVIAHQRHLIKTQAPVLDVAFL